MTKTSYQVFTNEDELKQFVIDFDPMKELSPVKREINWNLKQRDCNECGTKFQPYHIAQHFCTNCQNKKDKMNKRESVVNRMQKNPTITNCLSCGKEFYKTAPAMKNCVNCTPKGGEVVNKKTK